MMRSGRIAVAVCGAVLLTSCVSPSEEARPAPGPSSSADPTTAATAAEAADDRSEDPSDATVEGPLNEDLDLVYGDSFSDDGTKWPRGRTRSDDIVATTAVQDGSYLGSMDVRAPAKFGSHRMLAPEILHGYRDVVVSAQIRKAGTSGGAGVMCFQDPEEWLGYEFAYDSDGWVGISKRDDFDSYAVLAEDTVADLVRPRGANLLTARCSASAGRVVLVMTLNGREVLRTADARASMRQAGQAGMHMGTNRRGRVSVVFDDFSIRAAAAAAGPPPVIEPSEAPTDALAEVTFLDDRFADATSGWDIVEEGQGARGEHMGYDDGSYTMRASPPSFGFASAAPIDDAPPDGDVAVEADVRIAAGRGNAGVFCRAGPGASSGYLAGIGTRGGYGILRIGGDAPRPLTEPGVTDPALRNFRTWNTVRLECIGADDNTTLRLYANDKLLAEVVDPQPLATTGEVGLFVLRAGGGRSTLQATFDNFVARRQVSAT